MKVKEKVAGVGETYAVTLGVPEGPRPLGSPTRKCPVKRTLCPQQTKGPHQREESRWRRNRTGRSLSLLQIHRKNNRTVKKVYKTTSDR